MAAGPIELSLAGVSDPKEIARLRAQGILTTFQALPAGARASFTFDGLRITILQAPSLLRDKQGNVVGLQLRASATQNGIALPFIDGIHQVVNPPVLVPDGTTTDVVTPSGKVSKRVNAVENPIQALKVWLAESIRVEARAAGWQG